MDTKIRQTVQEKVDYCRCAQVNVIQKVRSVFRVKNILVRTFFANATDMIFVGGGDAPVRLRAQTLHGIPGGFL